MYGRGGNHGHVTRTICMNFGLPPIMFFIDTENVFDRSPPLLFTAVNKFYQSEKLLTFTQQYGGPPRGVCAPLIPENNALISPNP